MGSAHLHVATTVVRRAERSTWRAIETHGTEPGDAKGEGGVNAVCAAYLNRLSDLLFILARVANLDAGGRQRMVDAGWCRETVPCVTLDDIFAPLRD